MMLKEGDMAPDFTLDSDGGGQVTLSAIIDEGSRIVKVYPKVRVKGHVEQVLDFLSA